MSQFENPPDAFEMGAAPAFPFPRRRVAPPISGFPGNLLNSNATHRNLEVLATNQPTQRHQDAMIVVLFLVAHP